MSDSSTARDQPSSSMTDAPPSSATYTDESRTDDPERRWLERTVPNVASEIRKAGFWGAIVLPFLYLPLLVFGLNSWLHSTIFLVVLVVNLAALYVGHYHRR